MPIKIPNNLPAVKTLESENIFVMTEHRAITQDIRPLKILVLNLMPKKIETETQFARLLGNTPLQVEMELIHTKSHQSKNVTQDHLLAFYKTFDDVKEQKFDALPKEKDWITEAEEETYRIKREIEMLKSYEVFANAAYGIGKTNVHTKPSKPTTDTNVTTCGKKRCAYCDTLNDHVTGVCDRCGAPLGEV